jgi:hypothetical protein
MLETVGLKSRQKKSAFFFFFYLVEVKARVACLTRTGVVLVAVIRAVEVRPLIT